jgi:HlyD family secretion protein
VGKIVSNFQDNKMNTNAIKQWITGKTKVAKLPRWVFILIVVAIVGIAGFVVRQRLVVAADDSSKSLAIFIAQRDDLVISVTENGSIKAINSTEIKSAVEGRTTLINIVDEGTYITPEDVKNGKILAELDSSSIKEKLSGQEISFLNAQAGYTEAMENLDIQKKQNESDIQAGQMKARFALIDLHKALGETVAKKLLNQTQDQVVDSNKIAVLINDPNLGGDALQTLRQLDGDIYLKEQDLQLAKSKLEWTEKLFAKQYVSLNEKESDTLDKVRKEIAWENAKYAKELVVKYEFPKNGEKLLSDYYEAVRDLERIEARARSRLAQAQAQLESREATFTVQKELLEKQKKQLEACVIRAPSSGQVVYSSSAEDRGHWSNTPAIEIGVEIRERQKIISIPDPRGMKVDVKIHETWIDKINPGQKTKITVPAFPDKVFTGTVLKKAPLADPENWMNPDLKVYSADVGIDGTYDFLKTGMTAKVEIIVAELKNVITVPIQAVINKDGKKVCYVAGSGIEPRIVETGGFNDNFVEIKNGLAEGEKVLLNPPRVVESKSAGNGKPKLGPRTERPAEKPEGFTEKPEEFQKPEGTQKPEGSQKPGGFQKPEGPKRPERSEGTAGRSGRPQNRN